MRARDFRAVSVAVESLRSYRGQSLEAPLDFICVLDESLAAAQNSKKPTKAKARLMWWDYDREQYMEKADYLNEGAELSEDEIAENQIQVFNFSENKEYDKDTFGFADWKEPHLWFHGDCEPMTNRRASGE